MQTVQPSFLPLTKTAQRIRWAVFVASLAPLVGAFVYPALNLPHRKCLFQLWVGFPSPGCGLTRSFMAIARGDLPQAFSFHLFGPLLFGLFILISIHIATELIIGKVWLTPYTQALHQPRPLAYSGLFFGASFLTYYFIRLFIRFHNISLPFGLSHLEIWQSLVAGTHAL
jgi:Protein of unknown function (DUF2752)